MSAQLTVVPMALATSPTHLFSVPNHTACHYLNIAQCPPLTRSVPLMFAVQLLHPRPRPKLQGRQRRAPPTQVPPYDRQLLLVWAQRRVLLRPRARRQLWRRRLPTDPTQIWTMALEMATSVTFALSADIARDMKKSAATTFKVAVP